MKPGFARASLSAPLAFLLLAAAARAQTFSVIGMPDTQNYSEFYPQIYALQTQWIAQQREALDIRYVSHYGDVVNHGDDLFEWNNADAAMATLDAADVVYGVTAGNHDITPAGEAGSAYIPQLFQQYFGPARFVGKPWYGGASPSQMSSYQLFSKGGWDFLALHLECDGALAELAWAQGVLNQHRERIVLMTTHRYLQDAEDYTGGVPLVPSGYYPPIWYGVEGVYAPGGIQTPQIFDWFVRRNPNIALVQCGHFHEEFRQVATNVRGNPVHELLADYQDDPNGGDGWLRILRFDMDQQRIEVETYSPFLGQFRTADESEFSLALDFEAYRELEPTLVLQQQINGYEGTQDTWIDQANPNAAYGDASVRVSDDDTQNSLFSDSRGQALVRFEGWIGSPAAGLVPPGASILSAHLTLQLADDIDTPLSDPDFFLHQVLVPWSEGSTWNSLGGGLQLGSELGPVLAVIAGDNAVDTDGLRRIDVRASVQQWVDGAPNFGFAILPEIVSGNDDGIEILTSESANPLLRPALEIVYELGCGYASYGANASAAHTLELAGVGLPAVGGTLSARTSGSSAASVFTALSLAPASLPLLGGQLLVDPGLLYGVYALPVLGGSAQLALNVPAQPALAGAQLYLQSAAFEAVQPGGFAFSNGLAATICP